MFGSAFPASLAPLVQQVEACLPASRLPPSPQTIGPVQLQGERLKIPSRVYMPEPARLPPHACQRRHGLILSCLFTRHHDGLVREKHVRNLLDADEPWVCPFVVQLLGEYVVEIIQAIASKGDLLAQPPYVEFLSDNPEFVELTRQRAVSYWDCYYRARFPRMEDYPGLRLLDSAKPPLIPAAVPPGAAQ